MEEEPASTPATTPATTDVITFIEDFDSACSTPFVSAPSSPGRCPSSSSSYTAGFFYSAPASPIHFMLSSSSSSYSYLESSNPIASGSTEGCGTGFEFEFNELVNDAEGKVPAGSMTSADELFCNGQIRPMKLSSHLQRPQVLAPLLDVDENEIVDDNNLNNNKNDETKLVRGRDAKLGDRSKSLRRRARSMSPLRTNNAFQWLEEFVDSREREPEPEPEPEPESEVNEVERKLNGSKSKSKAKSEENNANESETTPSCASSRSSSVGRSSKRWVFLKEFLYRSKSEGRSSNTNTTSTTTTANHKFWTSLSLSNKKSLEPATVKNKASALSSLTTTGDGSTTTVTEAVKPGVRKAVNGVGRRRVARSAHELHYTANRAQAEELRRKTYLPYKQGLLGCLGFSSKSYGAMNGFARALNPVSSR